MANKRTISLIDLVDPLSKNFWGQIGSEKYMRTQSLNNKIEMSEIYCGDSYYCGEPYRKIQKD